MVLKLKRCFSSFPDSFRHEEGSQTHTFRIRECIPAPDEEEDFDRVSRASLPMVDGFIYGFCYFSRKRDETSSRGYDQVGVRYHTQLNVLTKVYSARLSFLLDIHGQRSS